jgi:cyclophilin family peptidyl-prolyl cis-trans isomerase
VFQTDDRPRRPHAVRRRAAARRRAATPQVELKTTMGDIVLELNREKAPKSVDNFIAYVKSGFYKGTIFHRVIDGFMIQGGGYDEKLKQTDQQAGADRIAERPEQREILAGHGAWAIRTRPPRNSSSTSKTTRRSTIRAATAAATPCSARCQGQETVDKIKAVLVDDKGIFQNIPVIPVVIKSATILKTPIQPKQ